MSMFKKATRKKLKARIALDGPAGSGKTFTALRFAFALAGSSGRVAVLDTEHRSASKYVGIKPDKSERPFEFAVCELEHYAPTAYSQVVKEAAQGGFDVLVIDSFTHAWQGKGGALDLVDAKAGGVGGKFGAWRDVTPMHRDMIETILSSPCHVLATMRSTTAYEVGKDDKGKTTVQKVGVKPIQREGVEYEFDVVLDMDLQHTATVSKTRCPELDGKMAVKPGAAFLAPYIRFLDEGENVATQRLEDFPDDREIDLDAATKGGGGLKMSGSQSKTSTHVTDPCGQVFADEVIALAKEAGTEPAKLKEIISRLGCNRLADVPLDEARRIHAKIAEKVARDRF